jgi:hypothetical protein
MVKNKHIDFFKNIEEYPPGISATAIMSRMVDGVGFRFFWATFNQKVETYNYAPGEGRWNIFDTVSHIWDLARFLLMSLNFNENVKKPEEPDELRESVLYLLFSLRLLFSEMDDSELTKITIKNKPFWHFINGPLEDMVSHVGAIDNLRRTAGDLPEDARFFYGLPPGD